MYFEANSGDEEIAVPRTDSSTTPYYTSILRETGLTQETDRESSTTEQEKLISKQKKKNCLEGKDINFKVVNFNECIVIRAFNYLF
jgi:hypothetical protein